MVRLTFANVDNIKKSVSNFNWNKAFENLAIDEKVALLNQTLLSIFRDYILTRQPPWMTSKAKNLSKERSKLTKYFYRNGQRKSDRDKMLEKSAECTREILEAKRAYILKMTNKLEDAFSASETYWTIINHLLYNKKIPAIPPLLVDGNLVSDFNLFNNFFPSICITIKNAITLPYFSYRTNSRINSFHATENYILLILKSLDSTKAHGCDNLSVRMMKICNESIAIPLKIIFDKSLKNGVFPEIWKRANVVPVHKKEDKSLVKNYRPISLLPIFGKIFERVIYNSLFNYFISNKLFTPYQSGFLPGDSCIAQLLSIIHEIQTAFDENPTAEVRVIFLDISKAFDKAWHDGLLYKLYKRYKLI